VGGGQTQKNYEGENQVGLGRPRTKVAISTLMEGDVGGKRGGNGKMGGWRGNTNSGERGNSPADFSFCEHGRRGGKM